MTYHKFVALAARTAISRTDTRQLGTTVTATAVLLVLGVSNAAASTPGSGIPRSMIVPLQADDFCSSAAGQFLSSTVGIIMALAAAAIVAGIALGALLEALPLSGRVQRLAHNVVGGVVVAIVFVVVAGGFFQYATGFMVIDPSMGCTPL